MAINSTLTLIRLALVPSVILMAATAFAVRSMPASILARTSGLKLRMVPAGSTSSGMTIGAAVDRTDADNAKFGRILFAADHALNIDDNARGHHHGGRWLP